MIRLSFRFLLLGAFVIFFTGCTKEENTIEDQLVGHWLLSEKTVDGSAVVLSNCEKESFFEFQEFNTCIIYDACMGDSTYSGWAYTYEMLNIAKLLPAGYYIDDLEENSLQLRRNDITDTGTLQESIFTYSRKQ